MSALPVFTPYDQFPITGRGILMCGQMPEGLQKISVGDRLFITGIGERTVLGVEQFFGPVQARLGVGILVEGGQP